MCSRVWAVSSDGLIEYKALSTDRLNEVLELLRSYFFVQESISVAVGLPQHPNAIAELDEITRRAVKDGVSLIAVEKATGKMIGCMINKINEKQESTNTFFEEIICKHPSARAYLKLNAEIDKLVDWFGILQSNCYFECMFVSVLPELRNKGVACELAVTAIQLYQNLKNGLNVKTSPNGELLPLDPVPTVFVGVTTSPTTKNILGKLGFTELLEIGPHDKQLVGTVGVSEIHPISIMRLPDSLDIIKISKL